MGLTKVIITTIGYTSFVSELCASNKIEIVGILDCSTSEQLKAYSERLNIPYKVLTKQQDEELVSWITEKEPDVISVFRMPFLLKEEIFSLPKYGTLNLHPSLLPNYRGPNPWFWVYFNVEEESGVTIHFIDKGEDTGDIVLQEKFSIPFGTKIDGIKRYAMELGTSLMIDALSNIESIKRVPQGTQPFFRARNIKSYEGLIDWKRCEVRRIWHLLNGFPNVLETNQSYLSLDTQLTLHDYYIGNAYPNLPTGEFVFLDNYYVLSCIDGVIRFLKD